MEQENSGRGDGPRARGETQYPNHHQSPWEEGQGRRTRDDTNRSYNHLDHEPRGMEASGKGTEMASPSVGRTSPLCAVELPHLTLLICDVQIAMFQTRCHSDVIHATTVTPQAPSPSCLQERQEHRRP